MIKKRLVDVWDKIEKYAIFIALILFAIFQLLDSFINNAILDKILNLNAINMFIAVILLYLFLYIDRRLPLQSKYARGIKVFDHFDEAVLYALADIQSMRQIDIFAHSSDGYYSLLRHQLDNMRSLEKIRIIVKNPDSENFISHLKKSECGSL